MVDIYEQGVAIAFSFIMPHNGYIVLQILIPFCDHIDFNIQFQPIID